MNIRASFSSASTFPAKLLFNKHTIDDGRILPVHVQLNPTNKCNLSCAECSCADRDKNLEIPWSEMQEMTKMFASLGTQSYTITGGGEPLLYPNIMGLIEFANYNGIECGLVTNGLLLDCLDAVVLKWIRVSVGDDRMLICDFFRSVESAVNRLPGVDWAFSYVASSDPDYRKMRQMVSFARDHDFTHIRIVANLLDVCSVPPMREIQRGIGALGDSDFVIYQDRIDWHRGNKHCLISLLKPVIGANGKIYPCCGAQYAIDDQPHDYVDALSMGRWETFVDIYHNQRNFDGSICDRCYYTEYNDLLGIMMSEVKHAAFV